MNWQIYPLTCKHSEQVDKRIMKGREQRMGRETDASFIVGAESKQQNPYHVCFRPASVLFLL